MSTPNTSTRTPVRNVPFIVRTPSGRGAPSPHSVSGTLGAMESINRQAQAQRQGAPENKNGGVWVSNELWKAIRRQLESKVQEMNALVDEHQRVKQQLTETLNKAQVREYEMEGIVRDMENALKEERVRNARESVKLVEDVRQVQTVLEVSKQEGNQSTEQMMKVLAERDSLGLRGDELARKLDDITHELKVEAHRHTLTAGRIASAEKETLYYKDKHEEDQRRVMELENHNRQAAAHATSSAMQVESLKEEVLVMRRPDEVVRDELARVQADNRRLVHLLERTSEFRKLMEDVAQVRDVHYVPLTECLVEEDLISYPYVPERDREVMLSREAYYWVPKEAFELVQSFLDRLFPRVPVQPFMMLLLQLNKVWRDHEHAKMAALRVRQKEELEKYRRKIVHREPYAAVVHKQKISSLKKQLKDSTKKSQKLDRYRELARKAGQDTEAKLLLDWGLATIEKISRQVADAVGENRMLRKRLAGVIHQHGLPHDSLLAQLDQKDSAQYGSPSKFIYPMEFINAVPTPGASITATTPRRGHSKSVGSIQSNFSPARWANSPCDGTRQPPLVDFERPTCATDLLEHDVE